MLTYGRKEKQIMTPQARRLVGIVFLVAAVVLGILNLKRVAGLGVPWAAPVLVAIGAALVASAKRSKG